MQRPELKSVGILQARWRRPSSLLNLGLLLLGAAIGGASAGAEPAPRPWSEAQLRGETRSIELELKERTSAGTSSSLRASLGSAVGEPVQLVLESGTVFSKLRLRRDGRGVLYLELERSQRGPGGSLKLQAASALAPGKRALLGRVTRPDGSELEIAATLR